MTPAEILVRFLEALFTILKSLTAGYQPDLAQTIYIIVFLLGAYAFAFTLRLSEDRRKSNSEKEERNEPKTLLRRGIRR